MRQFVIVCLLVVVTAKKEFRIAWMAPKKEYYGLSAASSIHALKAALTAIGKWQKSDTTNLPDHKVLLKIFSHGQRQGIENGIEMSE